MSSIAGESDTADEAKLDVFSLKQREASGVQQNAQLIAMFLGAASFSPGFYTNIDPKTGRKLPGTKVLLTEKVDLKPGSFYQCAIAQNVPVLRVAYFTALWKRICQSCAGLAQDAGDEGCDFSLRPLVGTGREGENGMDGVLHGEICRGIL